MLAAVIILLLVSSLLLTSRLVNYGSQFRPTIYYIGLRYYAKHYITSEVDFTAQCCELVNVQHFDICFLCMWHIVGEIKICIARSRRGAIPHERLILLQNNLGYVIT